MELKIRGDYHCHTEASGDCKTPLRDVLDAAVAAGLDEIAITDHGPNNIAFGMKRESLFLLRKEIDRLKPEYKGLNILLGIEANIHSDGSIDVDDEMFSVLDWVNAGYHFGSRPTTDWKVHFRNLWVKKVNKSEKVRERVRQANTEIIIKALERYKINMLTHPGDKGEVDVLEVAKVAEKRGTLLEINSSHKNLSVDDLRICLNTGVNFAVCSDAHTARRIADVDVGLKRIIDAQIPLGRVFNLR